MHNWHEIYSNVINNSQIDRHWTLSSLNSELTCLFVNVLANCKKVSRPQRMIALPHRYMTDVIHAEWRVAVMKRHEISLLSLFFLLKQCWIMLLILDRKWLHYSLTCSCFHAENYFVIALVAHVQSAAPTNPRRRLLTIISHRENTLYMHVSFMTCLEANSLFMPNFQRTTYVLNQATSTRVFQYENAPHFRTID